MHKNELLRRVPQVGTVRWMSRRAAKNAPVEVVTSMEVTVETGIAGDHYSGKSGKRQVTLIQEEHLPVVESLLGGKKVDPAQLRRNIVVAGINLLALKDQTFQVGKNVILRGTGHCHPCSKMEMNLGEGGYHAMRGHGGITARVIHGGKINLGDSVRIPFPEESAPE